MSDDKFMEWFEGHEQELYELFVEKFNDEWDSFVEGQYIAHFSGDADAEYERLKELELERSVMGNE